jgi:hypothetical protein
MMVNFDLARRTTLERIVDEQVGQSLAGSVSVGVDRIAAEIAREALAGQSANSFGVAHKSC